MEMNTELVCIIANLGYSDGDEYFKSIDCLESLKDIIRFLRHDDLQTCEIRRQLGYSKILQNDLIPLLISNPEDKWLIDILMRLLVNLTSAPHLCFEQNPVEEATIDSSERKAHEMELMSYLVAYKEAFAQKSAMSVISSLMASVLKKDVGDRDEDDELLLERVLLLIRNLLYVPADPEAEKRTDDDITIHDQLLWSLHENGIDDLLIYISSSEDEKHWCMHACEIISHMFREQNAEELARASEVRSIKEKKEDTESLKAILEKERKEKDSAMQYRGARHSKFGGAFWVKGRKALNEDQNLVYHRTLQSANDMSYDFDKIPEKKRRTKQVINEADFERKTTLSVRLFLKDFCISFLHHGYNNLLSSVKSSISSGKTQKNDESFYLSVMRFFMTFNRVYNFKVEYVSKTVGVQIFSDILRLILKYDDQYHIIKPTKGKERKIQFSRRIHLALRAFKELLLYVAAMLKTKDESLVAVAEVIQSNIFYIEEYRNVFLDLLRHWDPAFQTRFYLKDVIECFHLYLKLFETFLKDKGNFLTRTKKVKRKARGSKKKQLTPLRNCPIEISQEQAEALWQNELSVMLSARIQGRDGGIPDDTILPFDLDTDIPDEEQILNSLGAIQRLLRCNKASEAIAFLRASRDCWPDENRFGTSNMSGEEEFMCARAIFFMEIPNQILQEADKRLQASEMEDTQEELDEEEEDEVKVVKHEEKLFDLSKFLKGLAVPFVVEPYCSMLKTYDHNKAYTNHCVIKMLSRIAVDLDMFPMLFQLSLFITFKKILQEPRMDSNKEMKGFAKYILAKFFDIYEKNAMVMVDLLFWKSSAECYEIVEGYGTLEVKRNEKTYSDVGKWNFDEEQELLDIFDELKDEVDAVEKITDRLSEKGRTVKQIRNKLVRLRVLEKPKKRRANEWTNEETEELRNVFEEFKLSDDPLSNIVNALTFNKSKKWIIAHLLEIGLVEDKKELHVKRKRKKKTLKEEVNDNDDLTIDEGREHGYNDETEDCKISANDDEIDVNDDCELESANADIDLSVTSSLAQVLEKLISQGFIDEVNWIRSRLIRCGNDRQNAGEDEWHSVPIVPITEDHQNALSNKLFRQMLRRVGISPPAHKQEAFWRISSSLTPAEIQEFTQEMGAAKRAVSLFPCEQIEKQKLESHGSFQITKDQEDDSDDDTFERFISGSRDIDRLSDDVEDTCETNTFKVLKQHLNCDSSDDNVRKTEKLNKNDSCIASVLAAGKRTRRIAFSDDDSDEGDISIQRKRKVKRTERKLKKIVESDEDEDENQREKVLK